MVIFMYIKALITNCLTKRLKIAMEESIRNYKLLSEEKKEQMMVGFAPEIIYFRVVKYKYYGNDKLPEPERFRYFIIFRS